MILRILWKNNWEKLKKLEIDVDIIKKFLKVF